MSSKQFVLLATGALGKGGSGGGGGNIMMMHTTRSASECACEVTLCSKACQCPGGFLYQLLKLHGESLVSVQYGSKSLGHTLTISAVIMVLTVHH